MAAKVSDDWYKTFFNALAADFWDGAITEEWTAKEVGLMHQAFTKNGHSSGRLLDVFCGAGRHIPSLSSLGYQVTGIDISSRMLQLAQNHCDSVPGTTAEFILVDAIADITSVLNPSTLFDGAYCLGNSFGYTDAETSKRFLGQIVALLKPGATLMLNSAMLAETLMPNWETHMDMVAGGVHAKIENLEYDPVKSCLVTRFEFEAEAEGDADESDDLPLIQESHLVRHYIFTSGEVIRWLDALGCECQGIYGGVDKRPYRLGDEQWYGVFQKR